MTINKVEVSTEKANVKDVLQKATSVCDLLELHNYYHGSEVFKQTLVEMSDVNVYIEIVFHPGVRASRKHCPFILDMKELGYDLTNVDTNEYCVESLNIMCVSKLLLTFVKA